MSDEIETDKWKIFFKKQGNLDEGLYEGYIELVFRIKNREKEKAISDATLEELKMDLKDLGKWRKFKILKKDLEDG